MRSSHAVSNHNNDVSKTSLSPDPLPKTHVTTVSRIPRLKDAIPKQNRPRNQTSATGQEIDQLREETNIKFDNLEKTLEEINRQLEKIVCAENTR